MTVVFKLLQYTNSGKPDGTKGQNTVDEKEFGFKRMTEVRK